MSKETKLVFQEGTSNKFWNAKVQGKVFAVHYGRIGTDGQTNEKQFDTPEEAEKAYARKVAEKLKEGYREGAPGEAHVPGEGTNRPMNPGNFVGCRIKNYDKEKELENLSSTAYKLQIGYEEAEDGLTMRELLSSYVADPLSAQTEALIIGAWEECATGTSSNEIVEFLVSSHKKFPKLRGLFIGDIEPEESEISWINQSDMSPIFLAYPALEHFIVRGGTGLSLGRLQHSKLKSLIIESGGLPAGVARDVGASDLPQLTYLELWTGSENYGGDSTPDDFKGILSGKQFPKLKYLGIRDCEVADALAESVSKSKILECIDVLDMSMGNLSDPGALALATAPAIKKLSKLDLHWHYISDKVCGQLRNLGIRVELGEQQEEDEPGDPSSRYIQVSE